MPYETWPAIINPPQDGEPVDNATTARAHEALANRTEYLKQRLVDYSTTNGRILIPSVQLMDDVNVGDAVYYDPSNDVYGRALAEGFVDSTTGLLSATPRTFAIGICVSKNENYGDILVSGASDLHADFLINPADLFDNASNYSTSGTRGYLSSLTPGKLTSKPVSPLVQLGLFSSSSSFIVPLQKDIFESHLHYRFEIPTKPAASQNADKTGLKLLDGIAYVDYYDGSNTFPQLMLSIKKNDSVTEISAYNPARITITNFVDVVAHVASDGTERRSIIKVRIDTGNVKVSGVGETIGSTEYVTVDWPEYGEYVEIPNTGMSVSFYRRDAIYTNPLWVDMEDGLITTGDAFKVFLPDDMTGWTNANSIDTKTPFGSVYRLIHESIQNFDAVWPATPLESTCIETNGINRLRDTEFAPSMFGIFWKSEVPPWVWNLVPVFDQFAAFTPGSPDYTVINEDIRAVLYFTKTSLENSRSVVLSLGSNSPMISVTDCFSGLESSVGHLKLGLNLALNEENLIGSNYFGHSQIDPTTNKFKKTTVVSEIAAGIGISITKNSVTPGTSANCGPITIGLSTLTLEGAIEVVSLINAKEDLVSGIFPVIWFLQPSTGSYKMVSRVKIPNYELADGSISISLYPSVLGSLSQTEDANAVFNVTHYRIRNGDSISSPTQIGYITEVVFPMGGTTEYTVGKADQDEQEILLSDSSGSFRAGDQIYTVWERVSIGQGTTDDTYAANVGFSQVRWKINIS